MDIGGAIRAVRLSGCPAVRLSGWIIAHSAQAAQASAFTAQWYSNYKFYRGVTATFPSNQRPMAVYRSETNKTYFVWADGGEKSRAMVSSFDHGQRCFSAPVEVMQFPDNDGHRNPTLNIDRTGHITVFAGSHVSPTAVFRSTNPFDIQSIMKSATVHGPTTYPQPHELKPDQITVFYRSGSSGWHISRSDDNFASSQVAIDSGDPKKWIYAISASKQSMLHAIWTIYDSASQSRKNIWYAKMDGVTWTNSKGVAYPSTVPAQSAEKIFDNGADQVNTQDIVVDDAGHPIVLVSHGEIRGTWHWTIVREVDGKWQHFHIPTTSDRQFDNGALVYRSMNDLRALIPSIPSQPGEDGGNIEEWQSTDGGRQWHRLRQLTNDPLSHNHIKTALNNTPAFEAFWGYGDAHTKSPGQLKFLSYGKVVTIDHNLLCAEKESSLTPAFPASAASSHSTRKIKAQLH